MKKIFVIITLSLFSLISCNKANNFNIPLTKLDRSDKYRTYYEIFPRSYADSDGNYIGDLNGITNKLDYIEKMGFNGIWLMPINETTTYHGYDVVDYLKINSQLGTMDDFKNLLDKAHKKDINVIMDLVLNHSSDKNTWFIEGSKAFKEGNTKNKYYDYYNFSLTQDDNHKYISNGIYYEAGFGSNMPDLNLDSENLREDIKKIVKFYMDLGVDGFRLDATTWYYFGNTTKNTEFLKWLNDYTKSINPNAYIVGEAWTSGGEITQMYNSGIDSFFSYYNSECLGKEILYEIVNNNGKSFIKTNNYLINQANGHIPAPFITNHDNARAANLLQSKRTSKNTKFGQTLLQLSTGSTFTYYGDEIGMLGVNPPDENVRTHMDFGEKSDCLDPSGSTFTKSNYGSVKDQINDDNSILNYFKKINYIRNSSEAIRKGNFELLDFNDDYILSFRKIFNDEEKFIIINFNDNKINYDISKLNINTKNKITLCVDNKEKIRIDGNILSMPSKSIIIYN